MGEVVARVSWMVGSLADRMASRPSSVCSPFHVKAKTLVFPPSEVAFEWKIPVTVPVTLRRVPAATSSETRVGTVSLIVSETAETASLSCW